MPPFPKPTVDFTYTVATERDRLRAHRVQRGVPDKPQDRVVVGPGISPTSATRSSSAGMTTAGFSPR